MTSTTTATDDVDEIPANVATLLPELDGGSVKPHALRVAQSILTGPQLECFLWWLNGDSLAEIAKRVGASKSTVDGHLRGELRDGKRQGGAMKKLRAALESDPEIQRLRKMPTTIEHAADAGDAVRRWYASLRHNTLNHFVPRAVLMVMHYAADARREITFAEIHRLVPVAVVSHAMRFLRTLRYVDTDGITIRILKTPLDEEKTHD